MNNPLLIFCFISANKASLALSVEIKQKIQKCDSKSVIQNSNVRGVGTFFVTCSNLGQLFPYDLKIFYAYFLWNFYQNILALLILYGTFWDRFWSLREISVLMGLLEYSCIHIIIFIYNLFSRNQEYSTVFSTVHLWHSCTYGCTMVGTKVLS